MASIVFTHPLYEGQSFNVFYALDGVRMPGSGFVGNGSASSADYAASGTRFTARKDDLIENTETATFSVTFQLPSDQEFPTIRLVYHVKILDTTKKTVFLDIDGDGKSSPIEEEGFGWQTGFYTMRDAAKEANDKASELVEELKTLEQQLQIKDLEKIQLGLVSASDVLKIAKKASKGASSDLLDLASYKISVLKSVQRIDDFANDRTVINALQFGVQFADTVAELLVIKKIAKKFIKIDPAAATIAVAAAALEAAEIASGIKAIEARIDKINSVLLPQLEQRADDYSDAADRIIKINDTLRESLSSSENQIQPSVLANETSAIETQSLQVGDSALVFVTGTDADDKISFQSNDLTILDSGGGIDVLDLSQYTLGEVSVDIDTAKGVIVAIDTHVVTAFNLERIQLGEGGLALDLDGNAGQAYRLYKAIFDRIPDHEGLGYWINELDRGAGDIKWAARSFMNQEEFKTTYGVKETVSNDQFTKLLYQNVLDRAPDQEGLDYWVAELERGFNRDDLIVSFSESTENKANVIGQIEDGIFYMPFVA